MFRSKATRSHVSSSGNQNLGSESTFELAECRHCQKPIVWAEMHDGSGRVPLDPSPPVYLVAIQHNEKGARIVCARPKSAFEARNMTQYAAMVGHHATCSAWHKKMRDKATQSANAYDTTEPEDLP